MLEEPESSIQDGVKKALLRHPATEKVFRVNCGAAKKGGRLVQFHDIEGMTDLWIRLKPRFGTLMGYVETKRPNKEALPHQHQFMAAMKARGHIVFVATSAEQAFMEFGRQLNQATQTRTLVCA